MGILGGTHELAVKDAHMHFVADTCFALVVQ
jgi:hypothetical protein